MAGRALEEFLEGRYQFWELSAERGRENGPRGLDLTENLAHDEPARGSHFLMHEFFDEFGLVQE